MKNHEDLSFRLNPSIYTMSLVVEQLVPSARFVIPKQYVESFGLTIQDRKITQLELHAVKDIIFPILDNPKDPNVISDEKIARFLNICVKLSVLLLKKFSLKYLTELNLEIYDISKKTIQQQEWISQDSKNQALEIIDVLKDYTINIIPLITEREELLKDALKKIDENDLYKSLYGALLVFICIMIMISIEHYRHKNKFMELTSIGYKFVKNLDSYIDTLDILTDPDELKLLNDIDKSQ